jgi:hypothetical protein
MAIWRLVEGAADIVDILTNWRLYACVFAALAIVFAASKGGVELGSATYVIAAFCGFVVGAVWEVLSSLTSTQ